MALAVGYIYARRIGDKLEATLVASIVSFSGICMGCVLAYGLGKTVPQEDKIKILHGFSHN